MSDRVCGTCEHRDEDKSGVICGKCTINEMYGCHWKEHPAVTAYKELQKKK